MCAKRSSIVRRRPNRQPGAASVSPPWCGNAIADAFFQRPASAACRSETTVATAMRRISTFRLHIPSTSHGGLTPPRSWCSANVCRPKNDFCGARTQVHKSGGREPAVVCDTYDVREEWSAVRVKPNRHQERRASARRGRRGRREVSRESQEANCPQSYEK
jgi:hypothetical protein